MERPGYFRRKVLDSTLREAAERLHSASLPSKRQMGLTNGTFKTFSNRLHRLGVRTKMGLQTRLPACLPVNLACDTEILLES